MLSRFKVSLTCIFLVYAALAHASAASQEASAYETLKIKAMICKEEYMIGLLKAGQGETTLQQAYSDFLSCRGAVSKASKEVYKKVLGKAKGSDAKKALKDYQVAFMTFLDGIDAKAGETKYDYSLRFSALEDNLSMAKRRLDLELE
ncbi:hypothetical protein ACQYWY_02475 [Comamonas sediminis]|uniref:hypothetical protein n=1 Tax=Comamonas sediminis TaxID=1783360 RepID=UPI003D2B26D4